MKDFIITNLKKYKYGIVVLFTVIALLVFFWLYVIRFYYMPVQHISSISDGKFKVSVGELRRILVKSADGYERSIDNLGISVCDEEGNEVWSTQIDSNEKVEQEYLELFEFEHGEGIALQKGKTYYISTDKDEEGTKPYIFSLYEYRGSFKLFYVFVSLEIVIILLIVLYIYYKRTLQIHKVFLLLVIPFGILVNTIFPPLAVPDEKVHFREAYEASSTLYDRLPFNKVPILGSDYRLLVRATDYDSIMYLHDMASIAAWYEGIWDKPDLSYVPVDFDTTVTTCMAYVYVPASVGITIARGLRLNGRWLLLFGRWVPFLLCVVMLYYALKILPAKKELMLVLALLPECVYLFMSYSYDGINLALCFFIVALTYNLSINISTSGILKILTLIISTLIMIPIKLAYVPFGLLLLLLIDRENIKKLVLNKKAKIFAVIFLVVICLLSMYAITNGAKSLSSMTGYNGLKDNEYSPESRITIGFVKNNITRTIRLYYNTLWYDSKSFFVKMFGAVAGGIKTGTRTYDMPLFLVVFECFVILFSLSEKNENKLRAWKKTIVWISGLSCVFCVYTGLLLGDTKVMHNTIMGIQGRYFLPMLFMLPLVVDVDITNASGEKRRTVALVGCTFTFLMYYYLAFYFYSTNYFSLLEY